MKSVCFTIFRDLARSVKTCNYELSDHMTSGEVDYNYVCIIPEVTFEHYYDLLKDNWEQIINDFLDSPDKCNSLIAKVVSEAIVPQLNSTFTLDKDINKSLIGLFKVIGEGCFCKTLEIFKFVLIKYATYWARRGAKHEFTKTDIDVYFSKFQEFINSIKAEDIMAYRENVLDQIAKKLFNIYNFSIENELNTLIPNNLGSLKQFFITIVVSYYSQLHPIIWAQICSKIIEHIAFDLEDFNDRIAMPTNWNTYFFEVISKDILLNSGPFILKMLQMIRPFLPPDLAQKYGIFKLSYPQLSMAEVKMIIKKKVINHQLYQILYNKSASVGHVTIVRRVDVPKKDGIAVIKIIKPLSIAQSCWEYSVLNKIFDNETCEGKFITNMLESNGRELNVLNEKENIQKGHKLYTENYQGAFGLNCRAHLTTIKVKEGIIPEDCWFCFAMTVADGMPLSEIIENHPELLKEDTVFRASLHRCLDILVYKFISNVILNGFYHGDLHSGNIFFSYEKDCISLIDFGAVGTIDLFKNDYDISILLKIIIKSTYYNYAEMLDILTDLLNNKCDSNILDKGSNIYREFRNKLLIYQRFNIYHYKEAEEYISNYEKGVFSQHRISEEEKKSHSVPKLHFIKLDTIYKYMQLGTSSSEKIEVESKDILPPVEIQTKPIRIFQFALIMETIIKFYAMLGINIAIKFNEFYEFQKAYSLLLGVLHKTGYSEYRSTIAITKAIYNLKNITKITNLGTMANLLQTVLEEKSKFDKLKEEILEEPIE